MLAIKEDKARILSKGCHGCDRLKQECVCGAGCGTTDLSKIIRRIAGISTAQYGHSGPIEEAGNSWDDHVRRWEDCISGTESENISKSP